MVYLVPRLSVGAFFFEVVENFIISGNINNFVSDIIMRYVSTSKVVAHL